MHKLRLTGEYLDTRLYTNGLSGLGPNGLGAVVDRLEGFASLHGPAFYGLPRNTGTITLRREAWTPPESFRFGEAELKPLRAGEALPWRLV